MKRILSLFLTGAMLLGMLSVGVLADDFAGAGSSAAETTALSYDGIIVQPYRTWHTADSRWAAMKLGTTDYTVQTQGSLVVALTKVMIQAGLWKDGEIYTSSEGGKTVEDMVNLLNSKNAFTSSGALYWQLAANALELKNQGNLVNKEVAVADEQDQILTWVKKGYHLLISVKTTYGSHWVAVDEGMTLGANDGEIYVMDGDPKTNNDRYPLLSEYTYIEQINAYSGGSTHTHNLEKIVIAPTCTEQGVTEYICAADDEGYYTDYTAPLGHSYNSGEVRTAATCTTDGIMVYTCVRCGITYEQAIPKTGHSFTSAVTEPGCIDNGYTTYTCEKCGYSYKDNYTAAKGHTSTKTVTEPTCTEAGYTTYTCTVCGYTYQDDQVPALGHDYEKVMVPATETEAGYTIFTCKRCGDTYQGDTVVPHTHKWGEWKILTPSTATQYGTRGRTCSVCGYTATEELQYLNPFTDIDSGSYYYYPVLWAAGRTPQITSGLAVTIYGPDAACTRAQIVAFLHRANNSVEPTSGESKFEDVQDSSAYYYKDVLWGVENGIVYGITDTTFAPNQTVTRAQFITFLWRMAGSPQSTAENPFADVDSSDYYYQAVLWGYEHGIVYGTTSTTFAPDAPCTRGQVACFLYRYYGD